MGPAAPVLVTVCGALSMFVHFTMVPFFTVTFFGWNEKFVMLTEALETEEEDRELLELLSELDMLELELLKLELEELGRELELLLMLELELESEELCEELEELRELELLLREELEPTLPTAWRMHRRSWISRCCRSALGRCGKGEARYAWIHVWIRLPNPLLPFWADAMGMSTAVRRLTTDRNPIVFFVSIEEVGNSKKTVLRRGS